MASIQTLYILLLLLLLLLFPLLLLFHYPGEGAVWGAWRGARGGQHASVTESFSNYHNSHMPWCMKDWAFQPLRVIAPVTMVSEELEYK